MPMFYHLLMPSELVYPSKSHLVGTARQIASESFLMLLHVGTILFLLLACGSLQTRLAIYDEQVLQPKRRY
jgi:hypothetical protein